MAKIEIVSGDAQSAVAGTQLPAPLVVKVTDSAGTPLSGQLVNFVVVAGGGSVFVPSVQTGSGGIAQELWTLGTSAADSQRIELRAVDPITGLPKVFGTFRAFAVAGTATQLVPVGGDHQTGLAGAALALPLRVIALDKYNNPVANASVSWATPFGGGSLGAATSTTGTDGVASAQWTLGNRLDSPEVATATIAGISPVSFTALTGLPPSAVITKVSGDGQTGVVGTDLPQPLVTSVKLPDGRPLVGVTVSFVRTSGCCGYVDTPLATDVNGLARSVWTLDKDLSGTTVGLAIAVAPPVIFSATLLPGPAATVVWSGIKVSKTNYQDMIAGTNISWDASSISGLFRYVDSVTATVKDQYGNLVGPTSAAWSTRFTDAALTPSSGTTNNGVVKVHWVVGSSVGTQYLILTLGTGLRDSVGVRVYDCPAPTSYYTSCTPP